MVHIGVLEPVENELDTLPFFFPSKIGGAPVFLNLENIPSKNKFRCKICCSQMVFFLQLYSPIDIDSCYHRTIYIFFCRNDKCHKLPKCQQYLVLRTNLPLINKFYENIDYNNLSDKEIINLQNSLDEKFPIFKWTFPKIQEYLIIISEVLDKKPVETETETKKQLKILEEVSKNIPFNDGKHDQEIDQLVKQIKIEEKEKKDPEYKKFYKFIKNNPSQVLRYDRMGSPLFVSQNNKIDNSEIPTCEICGKKFVFEFQIMPQILNHVKFENDKIKIDIDWGTILIYTCPNSCTDSKCSYREEFAWKQDFD